MGSFLPFSTVSLCDCVKFRNRDIVVHCITTELQNIKYQRHLRRIPREFLKIASDQIGTMSVPLSRDYTQMLDALNATRCRIDLVGLFGKSFRFYLVKT